MIRKLNLINQIISEDTDSDNDSDNDSDDSSDSSDSDSDVEIEIGDILNNKNETILEILCIYIENGEYMNVLNILNSIKFGPNYNYFVVHINDMKESVKKFVDYNKQFSKENKKILNDNFINMLQSFSTVNRNNFRIKRS